MSYAKKKLNAALANTQSLPDDWFGNIEDSVDSLPSVRKTKRIRKNVFLDVATVEALEYVCKQKKVTFTDITNDILLKFVNESQTKKNKQA